MLLVLTALAALAGAPQPLLKLEIRAYRGVEDVTARTRVTVHKAGERDQPVARFAPGETPVSSVPPGIYDAQVVEEQEGRAVNIRWAQRLVVMAYPDEQGHHLEVINFEADFGALLIRDGGAAAPLDGAALHAPGTRTAPVAAAVRHGAGFLLVVRAGEYDLQIRRGTRDAWHPRMEVPLDRTRFWIAP